MTVSLVLRLVAGRAPGELAGEVEIVDSGERTVIRNVEDLLAIVEQALLRGTRCAPPDPSVHA